ncbi:MAG TPA: glycosyltransferase family 4 protein [Thermoanaerobaculia bacterium]
MRVAYLAPESGIAGGQRVIFQQAEGLARRGLSVAIVAPAPAPDWFPLRRARWEHADFARSRELPAADVRVATFWTTVAPALRGARGPVFHLCQGYEADHSFNAAQHDAIRAAYAQPTRKLAITPFLAERLDREGFGPAAFIGQAFDAEEFPPPPARRFDAAAPVVLVVGPFEADVKGVREALEALADLRARGVPFRLRRVSATPPPEEETAFGLSERYDVRLPPREMAAAYREADLLIGPCHPEEGFGLPVLEALSSGLPVLLSDTPVHRLVARAAASYFPTGDARALAAALEALLPDPARRRALSEAAPAEARRFRTEDVVERLLEEFGRSSGLAEESA